MPLPRLAVLLLVALGVWPAASVAQQRTVSALGNQFVRDQTILGIVAYGPAFAAAIADDAISGSAAYLVVAGGSFFASAEVARRVEITPARLILSRAMAARGAGAVALAGSIGGASTREVAGIAFLGGIGGTAAGLAIGGGLTPGEASATVFGHDLAYLSAVALSTADENPFVERGAVRGRTAGAWALAGVGGYALGRLYAGNVTHQVTSGDVQTLWVSAGIGALAGATAVADAAPPPRTRALAMLGGALVGTVIGERTLVRGRDHTGREGGMVALGVGAGALMGIGLGVLTVGEAKAESALALGFATAGALSGLALTERFLEPARDAGRFAALERVRIDPVALAAVVAGQRGHHSLLRLTF